MARTLGRTSKAKDIFCDVASFFSDMWLIPYMAHRTSHIQTPGMYRDYMEERAFAQKVWNKIQQKKALRQLARQRYIKSRIEGERVWLALTNKGAIEAMRIHIMKQNICLPQNQWCFVSFDIPESSRIVRNELRYLLSSSHFEMVHQSLWRSRKDVVHPLTALIAMLKVKDWIHIYVGVPITTVKHRKKKM